MDYDDGTYLGMSGKWLPLDDAMLRVSSRWTYESPTYTPVTVADAMVRRYDATGMSALGENTLLSISQATQFFAGWSRAGDGWAVVLRDFREGFFSARDRVRVFDREGVATASVDVGPAGPSLELPRIVCGESTCLVARYVGDELDSELVGRRYDLDLQPIDPAWTPLGAEGASWMAVPEGFAAMHLGGTIAIATFPHDEPLAAATFETLVPDIQDDARVARLSDELWFVYRTREGFELRSWLLRVGASPSAPIALDPPGLTVDLACSSDRCFATTNTGFEGMVGCTLRGDGSFDSCATLPDHYEAKAAWDGSAFAMLTVLQDTLRIDAAWAEPNGTLHGPLAAYDVDLYGVGTDLIGLGDGRSVALFDMAPTGFTPRALVKLLDSELPLVGEGGAGGGGGSDAGAGGSGDGGGSTMTTSSAGGGGGGESASSAGRGGGGEASTTAGEGGSVGPGPGSGGVGGAGSGGDLAAASSSATSAPATSTSPAVAASASSAGGSAPIDDGSTGEPDDGCGCEVAGDRGAPPAALGALALLGLALAARRQRGPAGLRSRRCVAAWVR